MNNFKSSHGVSHQPHSGQPLHGGLWGKGHQHCPMCSKDVEEVCGMTLVWSWILQEKNSFQNTSNSIDPHTQFTSGDAKPDGSIPFLDTIVMLQPDESLKTTVYRKPTHTDMYLHWKSYHHLSAKFSVINILRHRAKTVCSNSQPLKEDGDHLNKVLRRCTYPMCTLNRVNITQNKKNKKGTSKNSNTSIKKPYKIVPYIQGMSESCKNICRKHGAEMYFKGGSTIKDLLVHPKDKDNILQKSGVIYRYKCGRVDCNEEYIGESCRTFGERFREHTRAPSPILDHHNITGHEGVSGTISA